MIIQIIGIAASVLTAIAILPQLIKIMKERKKQDVSMLMFGVLICGQLLWVVYGIMKADWIIIVSNAFSFLINAMFLILNIYYRNRANSSTE